MSGFTWPWVKPNLRFGILSGKRFDSSIDKSKNKNTRKEFSTLSNDSGFFAAIKDGGIWFS